MGISPIEMQGGISRTQDFAILKHNEDNKVNVEQMNLHTQEMKETDKKSNQVNKGEATTNEQKRQDAKDEGKNKYMGDGGINRKNKPVPKEGAVIKKEGGSFDFRI